LGEGLNFLSSTYLNSKVHALGRPYPGATKQGRKGRGETKKWPKATIQIFVGGRPPTCPVENALVPATFVLCSLSSLIYVKENGTKNDRQNGSEWGIRLHQEKRRLSPSFLWGAGVRSKIRVFDWKSGKCYIILDKKSDGMKLKQRSEGGSQRHSNIFSVARRIQLRGEERN